MLLLFIHHRPRGFVCALRLDWLPPQNIRVQTFGGVCQAFEMVVRTLEDLLNAVNRIKRIIDAAIKFVESNFEAERIRRAIQRLWERYLDGVTRNVVDPVLRTVLNLIRSAVQSGLVSQILNALNRVRDIAWAIAGSTAIIALIILPPYPFP